MVGDITCPYACLRPRDLVLLHSQIHPHTKISRNPWDVYLEDLSQNPFIDQKLLRRSCHMNWPNEHTCRLHSLAALLPTVKYECADSNLIQINQSLLNARYLTQLP